MVMKQNGYINTPDNLDAIFAALADPTLRSILCRLAYGEAYVKELAEHVSMSQPASSKLLRVLEKAVLIYRNIDKQRRPARLNAMNMAMAVDFLYEFKISSKIFFCFIVFFTKSLSFQKFSCSEVFSNISSFASTSCLSKIPPNII